MGKQRKCAWLRKGTVLLLVFAIFLAYMPTQSMTTYAASKGIKASVYDGSTLKGSDGKPYYPNTKGGGYYWA